MSASIAISSVSLAIANSNRIQIKEMECKNFIDNFSNSLSTISDKQYYSECINLIYPHSISVSEIYFLKVLFVLSIIGLVFGVYAFYKEQNTDWSDFFAYSFFGFIIPPLIAIFIYLLIKGFIWLFGIS